MPTQENSRLTRKDIVQSIQGAVTTRTPETKLQARDYQILNFILEQKFASLEAIYFRFFDVRKSETDPLPKNLWTVRQRLAKLKSSGANLSYLWFLMPISLASFIWFNGIPAYSMGVFFKGLASKSFGDFYFTAISYWWKFFTAINYFADNKIPYDFYRFNFIWVQWIFILFSFVGAPWVFFSYLREEKEAKEEQVKAMEEAKLKEQCAREQAIERTQIKEEERRYNQRMAQIEMEKEKKRRMQEKEATDPNPWESGFLG